MKLDVHDLICPLSSISRMVFGLLRHEYKELHNRCTTDAPDLFHAAEGVFHLLLSIYWPDHPKNYTVFGFQNQHYDAKI